MTIVYRPTTRRPRQRIPALPVCVMLEKRVDLHPFCRRRRYSPGFATGDRGRGSGPRNSIRRNDPPVFANSARAAGDVARFDPVLRDPAALRHDAEVMDREDSASGAGSPTLFGYLRTPRVPFLVAPAKAVGAGQASLLGACQRAAQIAADDTLTSSGLVLRCAVSSVMLVLKVRCLASTPCVAAVPLRLDLNEAQILQFLDQGDARLIVSPVGGQGFLRPR